MLFLLLLVVGAAALVLPPQGGEHVGTLVVLHGLGSSGRDFLRPAQEWQAKLPGVKIVLPTAPHRPITAQRGARMAAWFDMEAIGDAGRNLGARFDGVEASRQFVQELLAAEGDVPVVLAGFSQGAALSLYTGLQQPEAGALAGVVAMGGFLPGDFPVAAPAPPVLVCHGQSDSVVSIGWAESAVEHLRAHGVQVEMKEYAALGHRVNAAMLGDVAGAVGGWLSSSGSAGGSSGEL